MDSRQKTNLIEKNNVKITPEGVWTIDSNTSFDYSDGDAAEKILQSLLAAARDRSSLSLELELAIYDWISEYHLSFERANIYRFFNLSSIENGLELGAGCGAITRYLGENNIQLDSIEGSKKRADICRLRCEDLDNVQIIHSNFNDLALPETNYDSVFLNGVLEYAGKFTGDDTGDLESLHTVLRKSLHSLTEDGVAFIAIENRMGLKYWLGAREDHYGTPFMGLYNYSGTEGIKTYDKRQWENILAAYPEYHSHFVYPFPDYKMAKLILCQDYLQKYPHSFSHLYRMMSTDNGGGVDTSMNEFLLWKSLFEQGQFQEFANSFIILLSKKKEKIEEIVANDFMHLSGRGRKSQFRTITTKEKSDSNVCKSRLFPEGEPSETSFVHNLEKDEYREGSLLVTQWLECFNSNDFRGIENLVQEYYEYIKKQFVDTENPGVLFDCLPFNIIVNEKDEWTMIDKEWNVDVEFTPEYLVFRTLFWFPGSNESILQNFFSENKISNIKDFIGYFFNHLSLNLHDNLDEYIRLEEEIQGQIADQVRSNPIENMLVQPFYQKSSGLQSTSFLAQVYWRSGDNSWSEDKSIFEQVMLGANRQKITFTLPVSNERISSLRIDPADRPGYFRIYSLKIETRSESEDDNSIITSLAGLAEISENTKLVNIEYCRNGLGELFISTTDDPHLIVELNGKQQDKITGSSIKISIELDWPKSSDYIVAMDSLGTKVVKQKAEIERLNLVEKQSQEQVKRISYQAEKLKETSDQVRSKDIYIDTIEREIEAMRQTRVWRTAEYLRVKIYYRLLDLRTLIQKSIKTLKNEGFKQFIRKTRQHLSKQPDSEILGLTRTDYNLWVEHNALTEYDIEEIKSNIDEFGIKPLFSIIVPVYDVDQEWLERTIQSVQNQLYDKWELCLCDDLSPRPHVRKVLQNYADMDDRIKVLFKDKNEGIALTTNAALEMATGDYIALLDHDDEITIDALYENAKIINDDPSAGLIYSDEDKLDMQGRRCDPFFKPDYSPELIRSQNYICHFTVIKKTIIDDLGGFRKGYDGSQDHDLILRSLEKTRRVYHIPKILYHWRKIPGSTAAVYDSKSYAWEAGRKAVEDALEREDSPGKVEFAKYQGSYRASYAIDGNPLVSIIIPFKDKSDLLDVAITSILEKTTYGNYEIIGISNNSKEQETQRVIEELKTRDSRITFVEYNVPFNFSKINNHAVSIAKGEYVILLNNDIEIISEQWLDSLLQFAQRKEIGAVGGRLYYHDNRIQHSGIVIGLAGVAGHPHHLFHKDDVGYYARSHVIHNVTAVTGACLMVEKALYEEVGGMDEENFGVAYNDVDFCLKLIERGYRNVYTPYCEMYHYESQSRGYDNTPEKMERLEKESQAFRSRWENYVQKGDPYYSPHLSLQKTNFSIKVGE